MSKRALIAALSLAGFAEAQVPPAAQTPLIPSTAVGDVAIFPNALNRAQSRIIGTDTVQNGLFSFTLDGYCSGKRDVRARSGARTIHTGRGV